MSRRPVCVVCEVEFRPVKNGVVVVEYASYGPVSLTEADEFECPKCGHKIIVGFGRNPFRNHYEPGFQEVLDKHEADGLIRVNREFVG
jgi:DNA-directed RNA polymerase subunit RPC12/RpoP